LAARTIVELALKRFFRLLALCVYMLLRSIILLPIDVATARLIITVVGTAVSAALSSVARGRGVLRPTAVRVIVSAIRKVSLSRSRSRVFLFLSHN
jgi:hypothetical protein